MEKCESEAIRTEFAHAGKPLARAVELSLTRMSR
jgi:hypothetical protein